MGKGKGKGNKKPGKTVVSLHDLQKQNNVNTTITMTSESAYGEEYEEKIEIKVPTLSRSQRVNYDETRLAAQGPYEIKMDPVPYKKFRKISRNPYFINIFTSFLNFFYDCDDEAIINFFGTTLHFGEIENIHIPRGNVDDGDKFAGVVYKMTLQNLKKFC